jgi:hypothetical protein
MNKPTDAPDAPRAVDAGIAAADLALAIFRQISPDTTVRLELATTSGATATVGDLQGSAFNAVAERTAALEKRLKQYEGKVIGNVENPHKCWTCGSTFPADYVGQVRYNTDAGDDEPYDDLECPVCEGINVTSIARAALPDAKGGEGE